MNIATRQFSGSLSAEVDSCLSSLNATLRERAMLAKEVDHYESKVGRMQVYSSGGAGEKQRVNEAKLISTRESYRRCCTTTQTLMGGLQDAMTSRVAPLILSFLQLEAAWLSDSGVSLQHGVAGTSSGGPYAFDERRAAFHGLMPESVRDMPFGRRDEYNNYTPQSTYSEQVPQFTEYSQQPAAYFVPPTEQVSAAEVYAPATTTSQWSETALPSTSNAFTPASSVAAPVTATSFAAEPMPMSQPQAEILPQVAAASALNLTTPASTTSTAAPNSTTLFGEDIAQAPAITYLTPNGWGLARILTNLASDQNPNVAQVTSGSLVLARLQTEPGPGFDIVEICSAAGLGRCPHTVVEFIAPTQPLGGSLAAYDMKNFSEATSVQLLQDDLLLPTGVANGGENIPQELLVRPRSGARITSLSSGSNSFDFPTLCAVDGAIGYVWKGMGQRALLGSQDSGIKLGQSSVGAHPNATAAQQNVFEPN
jgi:hypothetical protein